MKISETKSGFLLKSGATFTSWGNCVSVAINPLSDGNTEVQIESQPLVLQRFLTPVKIWRMWLGWGGWYASFAQHLKVAK